MSYNILNKGITSLANQLTWLYGRQIDLDYIIKNGNNDVNDSFGNMTDEQMLKYKRNLDKHVIEASTLYYNLLMLKDEIDNLVKNE